MADHLLFARSNHDHHHGSCVLSRCPYAECAGDCCSRGNLLFPI
jgi:hypothetical protein